MNEKIGNGRDAARLLAAALLAGTALAGGTALFATTAAAAAGPEQGAAHSYAIPAGTLSDALNRFAEQSQLQLSYDATLTQGRSTAGLSGQLGWRDALTRLLSGTGLVARATGANAVTIGRATTGAMMLDTLHVDGAVALADAETATAEDEEEAQRRGGGSIVVSGRHDVIDTQSASGPWGNKAIIDTPYAISVVSQDMIENVVAGDMDQLFKMNPVVQNSAPSTVYGTPYVTIRGFDSQKGVVDGLRLSSTLTGIAMEELASVEIMNGLSGFMYGVGNPGGVTNYVLKRPTYTPTRDITVGDYGNKQFFGHVDLGGKIDQNGVLAYRFNTSYQNGETSKENQKIKRAVFSGALDVNVSPDLLVQVEAAHTYYRIDGIDSRFYAYTATGGALNHWIKPLATDKTWTPDWTYLQTKTDRMGANIRWKITDNISLRSAYLYKRDVQDGINAYPAYYENTGWKVGWVSRSAPSYNYAQGAYTYLDSAFETFGIKHKLTVGGSIDALRTKDHLDGYVSYGSSELLTDPDQMNHWAKPAILNTTPWGALYKSAQSRNTNIIVGDDIQFTEKLSLMVGVNRSTVKTTNWSEDEAESSGFSKTGYNENALTPTISLVFKPTQRLTGYATYIEGLEEGSTVPDNGNYANAGEILKPFVSKQYEVGLKFAPSNGLLLTGALYRIEKANDYDRTENNLKYLTQDGVEVHQGLELTATGHVTKNLNVIVGGTLMDLKVTKTDTPALIGTRPTGVSDMLAKVYLDYSLPWVPGLSVAGGVYHSGKMYKDSANLQEIKGNTILDLGVHYKTTVADHPIRFDLNVANVTGEDYWATSYSLGSPRNVAFAVKYGF